MDINKLLKNVNNLDEYISFTQEITNKSINTKVQLNITTVLALKKIRSLEIEYLDKCYENGATCILVERLLSLPPSKTWGVLGKEMVGLLQYWLDAIRKYLLNHCVHWWSFLKRILKVIKEIHLKDSAMPNILVELTAECLFDIASRDSLDAYQRHEILHCLNVYCAESSREIRFALRNKFGDYFTKIAFHLATSSYFPCQYSALEALVRWLVPRQEPALRAAAAERWFPEHLCVAAARDIFLNTTWMNFFQDARNFLNALNEANGLITSVVCKRLTVGKIIVISGVEKRQTWLDINSSGKSISILLETRVLETVGVSDQRACETLMIAEHDTQAVQLFSQPEGLTISLGTFRPPRFQPSDIATGDASDVTIVVSSRVNLSKVDTALRGVFGDKYQTLLDLDTELTLSPPRSRVTRMNPNSSEEDRFSHPVEGKRRKQSGRMVKSVNSAGLVSPSTASTSSLAGLHVKLAALPRFIYDKEAVSVCAQPQLSSVTEHTERDDKSFHSMVFRSHGVCSKTFKPRAESLSKSSTKKAENDNQSVNRKSNLRRHLSPTERDEISTSCLLVATVGSADDSVINDTIERLSKTREVRNDNIVDLLIQEALQANSAVTKEKTINSGVSTVGNQTQEVEENSETIENTPIQEEVKETYKKSKIPVKKMFTIVNKSTTDDESNTEVINETQAYSKRYPRKCKQNRKQSAPKVTESKGAEQSLDVKRVEEFFSRDFSEIKAEEMAISPSLAKKINTTTSESSENFDQQLLITNQNLNANAEQFTFNDIEIIECLNDMVDKVCSDFEKCTGYLTKDVDIVPPKNDAGLEDNTNISKEFHCTNVSTNLTNPVSKPKKSIKLTYKAMKEKKRRAVTKKKNKKEQVPTKKMSIIIEQKDEEIVNDNPHKDIIDGIEIITVREEKESPDTKNDLETTVTKRKRKLYSPKDEREIEKERKGTKESDTEDVNVTLSEFKTYKRSSEDEREIIRERKGTKESDTECGDVTLSKFKTYKRIKAPKTTATCYKEIERERQKYIRLPRSRKSRGKVEESPSPITLKMNAMFEKVKKTVVSKEKIILADKTNPVDIYNFSSDSDDEDFKKKKMEIQKRTSTTTIGSLESTMSTRVVRQKTRPNYSEKSNGERKKPKVVKKRKAVKKTSSKSEVNVDIIDMADEKIREPAPEVLNTSIIVENPKEKNTSEVELILHEPPEMELITDDQAATAPEKKKTHRKTIKTEALSLKKEKYSKKNDFELVSDKEVDRTVSPLPGLVVESMPTRKDDINESETATMLQKFKNIYQYGPDAINESSNTQNMLLSDIERGNYSLQNVSVNNTDEICFIDYNKDDMETRIETNRPEKNKKNNKPDHQFKLSMNRNNIKTEKKSIRKDLCCDVIDISEIPDVQSEKSILTDGITAHGDLDEAPPSLGMIRESMHPREIEDLDGSTKDYFIKLNREISQSISKEPHESGKSAESAKVRKLVRTETNLSIRSPIVSVKSLSPDDIRKWLPSEKSTGSDSSVSVSLNKHEATESDKVRKVPKPNFRNVEKTKSADVVPKERLRKRAAQINKDQSVQQMIVDSPKAKSPTIPINTSSFEEFSKWILMSNTSELEDTADTTVSSSQIETKQSKLKLMSNTTLKTKITQDINISGLETKELDTQKIKPQTKSTQLAPKGKNNADASDNTTEEDFDTIRDKVKAPSKKQIKNISVSKKTKGKITNTIDSDLEQTTAKNKISKPRCKSVISPIKDFGDIFTKTQSNDESGEDLSLKQIRHNVISKQRLRFKTMAKNTSSKSILEQKSDSATTKIKDKNIQYQDPSTSAEANEMETMSSVASTASELFRRPIKRKYSPEDVLLNTMNRTSPERKKMRSEAYLDAVTLESANSTTVNNWLKTVETPRNLANDVHLSVTETLQKVLEMVDTTLVESSKNTTKKFVNLFVVVQQQLTKEAEQRRENYKTVVTGIKEVIASVTEQMFLDLEQRLLDGDTVFKEQLKKEALTLIQEDVKQKHAMFHILKDDVQAILDHIHRNRPESP